MPAEWPLYDGSASYTAWLLACASSSCLAFMRTLGSCRAECRSLYGGCANVKAFCSALLCSVIAAPLYFLSAYAVSSKKGARLESDWLCVLGNPLSRHTR